ncbi:hypothetical protein [Leptospira weilii]|nr:hypothetical protein [Leptospira weilii]
MKTSVVRRFRYAVLDILNSEQVEAILACKVPKDQDQKVNWCK